MFPLHFQGKKKGKFKILSYIGGILIGAVNGLFGAGGGIIAVPILEKAGFTTVADGDTETEVGLDLTQLSKDTLINLFATERK